ncbi:hypothetical protein CEXT_368901 [Caerostris extrusa]|uniref:Uncharacterized protein n=1 Tax=Caerostris extrusa TaxID=172846 RepID=A0AAV4P8C9_CAEEX|nr:hypothetical protein CEXT_368901 [Caerostris extrusa]
MIPNCTPTTTTTLAPPNNKEGRPPCSRKKFANQCYYEVSFQETMGMGGKGTENQPSTYRFVFLKHSVNIISPLTCLPELKHSYKVGRECGQICKSCQGGRG